MQHLMQFPGRPPIGEDLTPLDANNLQYRVLIQKVCFSTKLSIVVVVVRVINNTFCLTHKKEIRLSNLRVFWVPFDYAKQARFRDDNTDTVLRFELTATASIINNNINV